MRQSGHRINGILIQFSYRIDAYNVPESLKINAGRPDLGNLTSIPDAKGGCCIQFFLPIFFLIMCSIFDTVRQRVSMYGFPKSTIFFLFEPPIWCIQLATGSLGPINLKCILAQSVKFVASIWQENRKIILRPV